LSQSISDPNNPYQAPAAAAFAVEPEGHPYRKVLKDFRSQIVALGALWLIVGGLAAVIGVDLNGSVSNEATLGPFGIAGLARLLVVTGILSMVLGVCACLKQLWAVYVGLALSYLSVVGNLITFNICCLAVLPIVIIQAHRVIGFARQLNRAGIPLTTRPEQLT
jgi:hypothetical protein